MSHRRAFAIVTGAALFLALPGARAALGAPGIVAGPAVVAPGGFELHMPESPLATRSHPRALSAARSRLGALPISFEANRGQANAAVEYLARGSGYTFFLTADEAVMVLSDPIPTAAGGPHPGRSAPTPAPAVLRVRMDDANPRPRIFPAARRAGEVNYFKGSDPHRWHTGIPTFGRVRYHGVYPGVDVVYYGNQRNLEFDFVVAPGADPSRIGIRFDGADSVHVDAQGHLRLRLGRRDVSLRRPTVYQEIDGRRVAVAGRYVVEGGRVGFELAAYDRQHELVIDPVLDFSTYLGGTGDDFGCGIAVDREGNVYVVGWTSSVDFPVKGAIQAVNAGDRDAFVTKLDPSGTGIVYLSYLGGSDTEFEVIYVAVDAGGHAYVTGATKSVDFPVTAGAFQTVNRGLVDVFVAKLSADGSSLVYSTLLGGSGLENGQAIAVNDAGEVYVSGFTASPDFPTTPGVFQPTLNGGADAYVAKLDANGANLEFATYVGGSGTEYSATGIYVDGHATVYVTGTTYSTDFPVTPGALQPTLAGDADAYLFRLTPLGDGLIFSTYLGGSAYEDGRSVAVDETTGEITLTGVTKSANFPTTPGAYQTSFAGGSDLYVTRIAPAGNALVFSTFVGGSNVDLNRHMAVDGIGQVYLVGATTSSDFPVTSDALYSSYSGGEDAYVVKVKKDGSDVLFSTYLGGSGNDRIRGIALNRFGDVYVTGFTNSLDFPLANALQSSYAGGGLENCFFFGGCDAFVSKIADIAPVAVRVTTQVTGPVASGEPFPFQVQVVNRRTDRPIGVALVLILRFPAGPSFPILSPQPVGVAPDSAVSVSPTITIPVGAPSGTYAIEAQIGQPQGTWLDPVDQNVLEFEIK